MEAAPIMDPTPQPHSGGGVGAIIGIIIVVLLLAAGGAYFFILQSQNELVVSESGASADSSSDELRNIEADLNATGDANIEGEFSNLEQSL
ncbi:hypothetical protein A2852_01020 [Candidatus Adlerbacteria bacterium RIFCSPHIGHO2_01_FULL_54_23]|uniref:Uncharacterized protein n=3 Tax=Candidatus Adleribacteriota TaxID=1752736 RepID=A0A0G2AT32_9BACT|nr:MAG: hypothetical protein UY83_C0001G0025 [Candidatus Adlerbacteria bacterium GW2011_GWA1_54_10]KKW37580.1 MAG: hypothetical protein UY86_C0006G0025 [Candidatus Adlerbacteria bacterium GW2011_GWB1_54_7]OGC79422.1 MAG: hypothetical protein A2852_01020 [Candidatus Adlerbacteria bacterium RIFCSPHIGHO2_01_FULL_54_23]